MNKQELKAKLLEQINNKPSEHLLRDTANEKVRNAVRVAGKFNQVQESFTVRKPKDEKTIKPKRPITEKEREFLRGLIERL